LEERNGTIQRNYQGYGLLLAHRANPVVAEPLQQRFNAFTHALLIGDGSTGSFVQATPDKVANAEYFQSNNVENEVELELICPEFQFVLIHEYASPALKVELCKFFRDE
jgi:hypothetical protein